MKVKTLKRVVQAKHTVESELGYEIDKDLAKNVLQQCIRKCKCAGKDEDYLPLMYLCELPMQLEAKAINEITENLFDERRKGKCVANA